MRSVVATALALCVLAAAAPAAEARGGYLHVADAVSAAARYAHRTTHAVGGTDSRVVSCHRSAERVVRCIVEYDSVLWDETVGTLDEHINVVAHRGHLSVSSLIFN